MRTPSRMLGQTASVEGFSGTRVTFKCDRCGHVFTHDYSKGPVPKRIGVNGVAMLALRWKKTGATSFCPRCD